MAAYESMIIVGGFDDVEVTRVPPKDACHPEPQRRISRSRSLGDSSLPGHWACDHKKQRMYHCRYRPGSIKAITVPGHLRWRSAPPESSRPTRAACAHPPGARSKASIMTTEHHVSLQYALE
jgi:hypothetical protein